MKPEEIRRLKERKIQIFSRLKLRNIFPGEWESIYKGEGIEFSDIKPFEPEDDVRDLDLLTLAQSGEELAIQRVVERQLQIYVFADFSGSMQRFEGMFFPHKPDIRDIAVGLIIRGSAKIYSPAGFYPFGLVKKKFFPPKMGEGYGQEILDWIIEEENLHPYASSGIGAVLMSLLQLAQPRNMVFFISDFKQMVFEKDFTGLLRRATSKFDFIPVVIIDPLEKGFELKRSTRITVRSSSERGKREEIYLTPKLLQKMQEISKNHLFHLKNNFKKLNIEEVVLNSPDIDDCCRVFSNFFHSRKRTRT